MYKQPKVRQKKSIIFLAWLAPIVAILISFSMLEDYFKQKGDTLTLYSKDVKGLNVRKSHIEYKGVKIGDLKSIKPDPHDIKQFIIKAQIYTEYNYLIKEGSKFWIAEATIGMDKIENIGTVLTGNYIELIPPTTNSYYLSKLAHKSTFTILEDKPKQEGESLVLKSNNGSIELGTKITYKGVKVGEIINKDLINSHVEYGILIYNKYNYLLDKNSFFYIQKPFELNFSKKGLNIELAPFKEMLFGSIVLEKNDMLQEIDPLVLYDSRNKLYYKKEDGTEVILSGESIKLNQKVFYKGIEIGYVKETRLENNQKIASLFIKKEYENLLTNNTKFYKQGSVNANISLEGIDFNIASLEEIVFGGIVLEYFEGTKNNQQQYKLYNSKKDIANEKYLQEVFTITVDVEDLGNIKKSSKLYFKNVQIGSVQEISLYNDKPQIKINVQNKYKHLFGNNSKIYLEGIQVSLSKFKNISLEVLGDKFMLIPSYNDGFKTSYKIDGLNPIETKYKDGKRFIVKTKTAKDLGVETPILYKYIKIGQIEKVELDTRTDDVKLHIFIEKQYMKYINDNTVFFLDKVIDAQFGLFDSKVEFGSLKTLLNGGINISHTDSSEDRINNKDTNGFYTLYRKNPFSN